MKGTLAAMGVSGLLVGAQQAASMLDQEYSAIDPTLEATIHGVNKAVSEGFSVWQIAVATICLPIAIKGMEIYKTHAQSKQEEKREALNRETLKLKAELEERQRRDDRQHELEMARIRQGQPPAEIVPMGGKASA